MRQLCCPVISDKGRIEFIGASTCAVSTGLLQCCSSGNIVIKQQQYFRTLRLVQYRYQEHDGTKQWKIVW